MKMHRNKILPHLFVIPFLIFFSIIVFLAGSTGPFILDDIGNLNTLTGISSNSFLSDTLYFITNGTTSSLGRPITLLTFAAQHNDWPHNPYAFKIVNIAIHAFNVCLVFYFLRFLQIKNTTTVLLLVATLFWAVNPIHVYTVLYTVQRMTLLACTFSLIALIIYCHTIYKTEHSNITKSLLFILINFILILGVLSKENAVLTYAIILLLNVTFFKHINSSIKKIYTILCSCILAVVAYEMFAMTNFDTFPNRNFDAFERIATQSVILLDYLTKTILPLIGRYTIYGDGYSVYTFNNPIVIFSFISHILLLSGTYAVRKRSPLLFIGLSFFYLGHIMESTFLNLELYFEHRNYFPAIGLAICLWGLIDYLVKYKTMAIALISIILSASAFTSVMESKLFGDEYRHAVYSERQYPNSIRAKLALINELLKIGKLELADKKLSELDPLLGGAHASFLLRIQLRCISASLTPLPNVENIARVYENIPLHLTFVSEIRTLSNIIQTNACPLIEREKLIAIFNTVYLSLLKNTAYSAIHKEYYITTAYIQLSLNNIRQALDILDSAFEKTHDYRVLYVKSQILLTQGFIDQAIKLINDTIPQITVRNRRDQILLLDFQSLKDSVKKTP